MFLNHNPAMDDVGASCDAALSALDFLRQHGGGLCDLLGLLAEEAAFDALCDLNAQSAAAVPDARLVRRSLRTIHDALACQKVHLMDMLSVKRGYCVDTSVRWYGARVSDLLAAFR